MGPRHLNDFPGPTQLPIRLGFCPYLPRYRTIFLSSVPVRSPGRFPHKYFYIYIWKPFVPPSPDLNVRPLLEPPLAILCNLANPLSATSACRRLAERHHR
jgi:hypothetical protein